MAFFRKFSSSDEFQPQIRNIDSDAPVGMRYELIDLIFHIIEQNHLALSSERMHRIICQSLGERASGQPYGGYRYAAGRDLVKADWTRVFDLICRLWPEYDREGVSNEYRQGVNRILSGYGIVWELNTEGRLQRHLPMEAHKLVHATMNELRNVRFAPALSLFNAATDAFDARPRRDRDTCSNIFDCMESVAKIVFNLPNATFGAVLSHIRKIKALQNEVISVLETINALRNKLFGHGMTVPFNLSSGEVDFIYLTCIGAISLFMHI